MGEKRMIVLLFPVGFAAYQWIQTLSRRAARGAATALTDADFRGDGSQLLYRSSGTGRAWSTRWMPAFGHRWLKRPSAMTLSERHLDYILLLLFMTVILLCHLWEVSMICSIRLRLGLMSQERAVQTLMADDDCKLVDPRQRKLANWYANRSWAADYLNKNQLRKSANHDDASATSNKDT